MHQFLCHFFLAESPFFSVRIVHRQIRVDPYFDISLAVGTNLTLLNAEVLRMDIDATVPLKCLHHHKQVLRKGDIFNFAKPAQRMFDVYFGTEGLRTKLSLTFLDDEASIDNIGLITTPVE